MSNIYTIKLKPLIISLILSLGTGFLSSILTKNSRLVSFMIFNFYKINKCAAYLQIPYLLWLIFAAYLNYNIILLNI